MKLQSENIYRLFVVCFFLIALSRLFFIQVIEGQKYEEISRKNYVRIKRVNASRGMILDEKLRPIVDNVPSVNLYFRPFMIKDRKSLIQLLSECLNISGSDIEDLIYKNRFRAYNDILIAENLQLNVLAKISEKMNYYPELILKAEVLRNYHIQNHFTGYIGKINEHEFKRYRNEDYTINSKIGKLGLERYYEGLLAGKSGYEIIQVDAHGRSLNFFKQNVELKPVNGFNLVLTINIELQEYIQSIFPQDKAGAVVVMNPLTGGILSYNSFPEYDQNWFASGISNAQWDYLQNHSHKPLLDRVVLAAYPPASTYKVISAAFGLEKNYITEHTKLANCSGGMQIGNRFYKCWNPAGHGRTNVYESMAVSCDVYYYDLSARFDLDEFSKFSYNNYIFMKTGIDLPFEREGFFPSTQWYTQNYGRYFSSVGLKANLVIGQGEILTTPLAICNYYAAIANDGVWQSPHLLDRGFNENSINYKDLNPKVTRHLPLSETTLKIIQKSLYDTVYREDGTGRLARVKGAEVYAKTGSAENPHGDLTHAYFVGYAKWNNLPEIAFLVLIENAGHGGSTAGPIAKKIIEYYQNNVRNKK